MAIMLLASAYFSATYSNGFDAVSDSVVVEGDIHYKVKS